MERHATNVAFVSVLVFLTGCASTEIDGEVGNALAVAESAITQAEEAGATASSQLELQTAREKLDEARRLADEGEEERAQRLADEAIVEAELAAAKARRADSVEAVEQIEQGLATLRQEALDDEDE